MGYSCHPNATYELKEGGKLGVITFPLESFFDGPFTVSGHAIMEMSEQSFHLKVDYSATSPTAEGPCDALTPQEEQVLEELNLSNTKETGGCNCEVTRPSSSLALSPPPPEQGGFCPEEQLVSSPTENEITL